MMTWPGNASLTEREKVFVLKDLLAVIILPRAGERQLIHEVFMKASKLREAKEEMSVQLLSWQSETETDSESPATRVRYLGSMQAEETE